MLDRDIAQLYSVETKVLNQAVKRNLERFPLDFRFQLTQVELFELVTICDRFPHCTHKVPVRRASIAVPARPAVAGARVERYALFF